MLMLTLFCWWWIYSKTPYHVSAWMPNKKYSKCNLATFLSSIRFLSLLLLLLYLFENWSHVKRTNVRIVQRPTFKLYFTTQIKCIEVHNHNSHIQISIFIYFSLFVSHISTATNRNRNFVLQMQMKRQKTKKLLSTSHWNRLANIKLNLNIHLCDQIFIIFFNFFFPFLISNFLL